MSRIFLGYWNVSVILTYLELISAFTGITLAADGQPERAILCLAICGVCDMFDGKIARAIERSEDACVFGIQIDSLCDLVSFGVLPALIVCSFGITGALRAIPACYALCALIRLAYFNVSEQKRRLETTENRKVFEGLPVTTAALVFPLIYLLSRGNERLMTELMGAVMALMAVLFISRIRVKKPQI
ncbi:MAG: CDP-alcohol phosphatidyltransferase family protein [Oscillospiraceae bacterium]|nr:CDP-alcohol phosphatidyltransferase family protein [Oscillospiraceae bacterium]